MNKMKTISLSVLIAGLSVSANAETLDSLSRKIDRLSERMVEQQNNAVQINGFATFSVSQSDNKSSYHRGVDNNTDFRRYTKMGVQMQFNLDDKTSVVTQLVSKGENDFETKAEWLYLKHDFGNGFTGKMGRLRKPNYLLSEFFDVGYAMPWTQPPVEVYGVLEDSANYEAVDLTYDFDLMDWTSYVQVQYGKSVTESAVSDDLVAVNFSMNKDSLTFRAGYSQANASFNEGSDLKAQVDAINAAYANTNKSSEVIEDSNKGKFMGVAIVYDDGNNLLMTEANSLKVDSLFPDQDGYYVMYGRRIDAFTPYVTYAHNETTDDSDRNAAVTGIPAFDGAVVLAKNTFNKEQDRKSVGIRYDYKPGVALKLQYDMIDSNNSKGEFDALPEDDTANIVTFSIDTVF